MDAVGTQVLAMFRDEAHLCSQVLADVLAVLRATDDDVDVLYGVLAPTSIRSNPDFVRLVMTTGGLPQAATLAFNMAKHGMTDQAEVIADAVLTRFPPPFEPVRREWISFSAPWEALFGGPLLKLRTEENKALVDSALGKIVRSLDRGMKQRSITPTDLEPGVQKIWYDAVRIVGNNVDVKPSRESERRE
jgi:hypothetical protein